MRVDSTALRSHDETVAKPSWPRTINGKSTSKDWARLISPVHCQNHIHRGAAGMSAQVDQFSAYLDRGEIKYEQDSENSFFRMMFDGKHGDIRVLIVVEDSLIQVFSHPANKIPENSRRAIAEAVCRANYGLKVGSFELDMEDGELRYQTSIPLGDDFPDDDVLDHILYVGGAMVDRYVPAFLSIIYGNEDVKLAIEAAEM
ncbi:MAG TPA: YbjN domain-containing protein [Rhodopirellula baltica]|uniref:Protein containing DUF1790 n=2 Tax=Pirellulaceae TaxID=2691357 RepID=Q7UQJ7_RHOBA|nr:hypothetical protein RB6282 [Rhodopirellula baltica SH 1]HBE62485.1 YbjN domain-containing protein [Rhodopirellula baltica]